MTSLVMHELIHFPPEVIEIGLSLSQGLGIDFCASLLGKVVKFVIRGLSKLGKVCHVLLTKCGKHSIPGFGGLRKSNLDIVPPVLKGDIEAISPRLVELELSQALTDDGQIANDPGDVL